MTTGLSTPRSIFGIHSFAPYKIKDGTFYGILKVLESSTIALAGKNVDLYGGSNKYPWASETGEIQSEISLKLGQFEDFMIELFLGKKPSPQGAEASGNCTALTNKSGTLVQATTGLASVSITTAADAKFGKYVVVATAAKKFKVYISTDVDFGRGTAVNFQDDTLLAIAEITTADTSAANVITGYGLTIIGGSGTVALNVGDTATFEVLPINTKSSSVVVGGASDIFPEFGALVYAQHRGSDEMFEVDAFRCKAAGMPVGFDMFAWQKVDLKAIMLFDSARNGVFSMRYVAV